MRFSAHRPLFLKLSECVAAVAALTVALHCMAGNTSDNDASGVDRSAAVAGQGIDEATGLPSYFVQLRATPRNTSPAAASDLIDRVLTEAGGNLHVRFRYQYATVGFAAAMNPADAEALRANPLVARVEPDMEGSVSSAPEGAFADPNSPNPWGLRRISQPDGLAPAFQSCGADGTGVTVVVIDSGINPDHTEFAGRIKRMENFYPGANSNGGRDIQGHGTHVAGCAAGATTGVAPGASIVSLAVTDSQGTFLFSNVVAALNWVLMPGNVQLPAVVNMSLSGQHSGAQAAVFEEAISNVTVNGIPVIVAAGNESWPATWQYPAASAFALAVGACDADDHPAVFSNFGPSVGIWAPGTGILAADWTRAAGGLKLSGGTSMASPIVAGAAALYLQRHPPTAAELEAPITIATRANLALMASAARGKLSDQTDPGKVAPGGNGTLAGSANRLLQACDGASGITCEDEEPWIGDSKSVILGNGITPINASFQCVRNVRSTAGPVSLTVNTVSLGIQFQDGSPVGAKARLAIFDAATQAVLWDSNAVLTGEAYEIMARRTVRASSLAGVYVMWQPVATSGSVGYGYAMTASIGGGCGGDLDGSGSVDTGDLSLVLMDFGMCPSSPAPCVCDMNWDGVVDNGDIADLLMMWGPCIATMTPGYVADCSGNPVLRSYYGDSLRDAADTYPRPVRPDPINAPGVVYPVSLDCPTLGWDSDEGNQNVFTYADTRPGACTLPNGICAIGSKVQCDQAQGYFWGRGVACEEVPGLAPLTTLVACEAGDVGYGLPVAGTQPDAADPTVTIVRQQLDPGIHSISSLRVVGDPQNIAGSSSIKLFGWSTVQRQRRLMPATELAVRVTVRFRDGGAPLVVDREAVSQPYGPAGDQMRVPPSSRLITVSDILAPSSREVLSISVQAMPEGIDCISSMRVIRWGGRQMAAGEAGAGAEYTPDGGATWLPLLTPEGARFQSSMCITP